MHFADGISILELCLPPPSNTKFQIGVTIRISLEKKIEAIVSWVLNSCCRTESSSSRTSWTPGG